jgi:hypothetical protein
LRYISASDHVCAREFSADLNIFSAASTITSGNFPQFEIFFPQSPAGENFFLRPIAFLKSRPYIVLTFASDAPWQMLTARREAW